MSQGPRVASARAVPGRRVAAAGGLASVGRLLRYRVLIPLLRSRHPPAHTARGVAAGLFWGLVPLPGLQTVAIVATWKIAQHTRWRLSLVPALAWQWINNPLTVVPLYYLFYVTGHVLVSHGWPEGYGEFVQLWRDTMSGTPTWFGRITHIATVLGWPTFVGSLPWAVGASALGYRWTLAVLRGKGRRGSLARRHPSCEDLQG
jgi:uncharacterized protein (DUF2062 family)